MKFKIICVLLFSAMYHNMVYGLEVTWDARIPSGVHVLGGALPGNQTDRLRVPQQEDRMPHPRVLFAREIQNGNSDAGPEQQVPLTRNGFVKNNRKDECSCYFLVTPENEDEIEKWMRDQEGHLLVEMVDINGNEYYKITDLSIKKRDACVPNSPKKRKAGDQGDESRNTKKQRPTGGAESGQRVFMSLRGAQATQARAALNS